MINCSTDSKNETSLKGLFRMYSSQGCTFLQPPHTSVGSPQAVMHAVHKTLPQNRNLNFRIFESVNKFKFLLLMQRVELPVHAFKFKDFIKKSIGNFVYSGQQYIFFHHDTLYSLVNKRRKNHENTADEILFGRKERQ